MDRYLSMTEIGKHDEVPSRVAGAWLKRLGLLCEKRRADRGRENAMTIASKSTSRTVTWPWFRVWTASRKLARGIIVSPENADSKR